MNTAAFARMHQAELRREQTEFAAASAHLRRTKILLGLLLAVLFWFSVPYAVPNHAPTADQTALQADNAENFAGSASRQVAVPIIGLLSLYMLWRLPRRGILRGRLLGVVLAYVTLAATSFLWSEDPRLTAKRLVVFGFDCLFAYALARTSTAMEVALWGLLSTGVVGLISLFVDIAVLRNFAPFDPDYRLTGVMTANYQGMNLVVCCLCAAALMLHRPRWLPWLSAALGTAMVLLLLTRARVGTLLCFGLLAVILVKLLRDRLGSQARAVALVAALLFVLPAIVYVAGKDLRGAASSAFMMGRKDTENTASLSNRLPLWTELMDSVETHPWLGFGYGAFWTEARVERISKDQGWPVPHAHDTYLDQTISFGVLGGALYTVIMFSALAVSWHRYRRSRTPANLLSAALLTWLVLLSLTESAPLEPHLPTILVYVAVVRMCLAEGSAEDPDPENPTPSEAVLNATPIIEGLPISARPSAGWSS